jgi:ubiquitin-protein ligase
MYHPNIAENGVIELAILKKWTVDKDMKSLFDEIKEVLKNPNLDLDYLANIDASNLFLSN